MDRSAYDRIAAAGRQFRHGVQYSPAAEAQQQRLGSGGHAVPGPGSSVGQAHRGVPNLGSQVRYYGGGGREAGVPTHIRAPHGVTDSREDSSGRLTDDSTPAGMPLTSVSGVPGAYYAQLAGMQSPHYGGAAAGVSVAAAAGSSGGMGAPSGASSRSFAGAATPSRAGTPAMTGNAGAGSAHSSPALPSRTLDRQSPAPGWDHVPALPAGMQQQQQRGRSWSHGSQSSGGEGTDGNGKRYGRQRAGSASWQRQG